MTKKSERRVEEITEETIEFTADTLTGDIRDAVLDRFKHTKKPWEKMSHDEKETFVLGIEDFTKALVSRAVRIIAAEGRQVMTANLEKVTIKDGIKAELSLSKFDPERHLLIDSQGQAVLLVVANPEAFEGEKAPVDIPEDQQELLDRAA